jgi:hypothetical protein
MSKSEERTRLVLANPNHIRSNRSTKEGSETDFLSSSSRTANRSYGSTLDMSSQMVLGRLLRSMVPGRPRSREQMENLKLRTLLSIIRQ